MNKRDLEVVKDVLTKWGSRAKRLEYHFTANGEAYSPSPT